MYATRMDVKVRGWRRARRSLIALGLLAFAVLASMTSLHAQNAARIAPPGNLSYVIPPAFTVGTAITPLSPTVRGRVTSWSVRPSLPAGLRLSGSSGVISGTPLRVEQRQVYTITAANSAGSTRFRLPLSVQLAAPSALSYTTPVVLTLGAAITPLQPTVTGSVRNYSVTPTLPAGLALNRRTGVISGTPTAISAAAPYLISASNATGTTTFTLTLSVDSAVPTALSYPTPAPYPVGIAIAALTPTVTGTVSGYTVTPALPAGLVLDPLSGIISGTPSAVTPAQSYLVSASNGVGHADFSLLLSVIAGAPSALSYTSPALLTLNVAATPLSPTVTGSVDTYAITPALPAGLQLDGATGIISGTPTALSAQAPYVVTASNGTGGTNFTLQLGVGPGPVIHLSGAASDANNLPLTYYWKTTDGTLVNVNGPEADWQLPAGPGLHFAYLLVGNGSGGYAERRVVVNTDVIGTPIIQFAPIAMLAPAGPSLQGDYYRSFVQAGPTATSYFGFGTTGGHRVMASGVGVYVYANVSPYFPRFPDPPAITNLRGEYVVAGLPPATNYAAYCGAQPGLIANGGCVSESGNNPLDGNFTMLDVAITDWFPGGQHSFQTWPWLVGTLKLADNSACGIDERFFGVQRSGKAVYTDAFGTPTFNTDPNAGTIFPAYGPVAVNEFMDFALPTAGLIASQLQSTGNNDPLFVQLSCENANPLLVPVPSTVSSGITDVGLNLIAGVTAPTISLIEARYQQQVIASFAAPAANLPPPAMVPSDINPRANAFLTAKGSDSRPGSCQYYKAVGAAQSCDANGVPAGTVTFDDWKRAVKLGAYALPGPTEYTATYVNKMDLNLTRNHHSISYGPGQTAAYVCNHAGPPTLNSTADEVDAVINDAVNGRKLVACVAMDYTSTPGVNVDASGVAQPFTRFMIFGPSGELLPSINLDGRGEKFVPGACVACHGGDHYAGHYPEDGTGVANIGAHFLPYDVGNFEFSRSAGLTQADQEESIYQLNQNLLNAGPTLAAQELIAGWYANGHTFDLNYVPASWLAGTPAQVTYYKDIEAHYCRSCHVALTEGYNFDHLANYRLPNGTYRSTGTYGFLATQSAQCGPAFYGLPSEEFSMPNSLVTFNRFWALFVGADGNPGSAAAHAACNAAISVQ